jgi:methionine synthase II (cobalamin-independent)
MSATWPWTAGGATGVGSLPGTDVAEAVKLVFGELPDLPHLPELPDRGPGADLVGRGAAILVDLAAELYAGQWRVAARPGRDRRRALDLLERDLDALTEAGAGYTGPIKIQVAGPWTLAAAIDLPIGGRVLRDHGATRDLADSLAEGVRAHAADVARRLPGATVLLQVDEPSLPAVLAGRVRTESGLYTYRAIEAQRARETLASIVESAGVDVIVHCCAPDPPLSLFRDAGARAVSFDLTLLEEAAAAQLDALGEVIDAGLGVLAGVVPSTGGERPSSLVAAQRVTTVWRRLGFGPDRLAAQVVVTPTCGLAGATPGHARAALAACVEAGRRLVDEA